jgi:hypothetical protein
VAVPLAVAPVFANAEVIAPVGEIAPVQVKFPAVFERPVQDEKFPLLEANTAVKVPVSVPVKEQA